MNRVLVAGLVGAALSSGCGPRLRPADAVVRVGNHELTTGHLEELVRAMPPEREPAITVPSVVRVWIDFTLAADAFAGGLSLTDSTFMAEVMAPRQAAEVLARLHGALAARRPGLRPGEADRLYASDSVRILQQILIPVPNWRDSSRVAASRRVTDSVLALSSRGRPFSDLAKRFSVAIGPYGGAVSMVWSRTVPARVRPEIWAVKPGGTMAGRIPAGFVIVHRPYLSEVRSEVTADLLRAVNAYADSVFADSVSKARRLRVAADGVSKLRLALSATADDTASLASFQGGSLSSKRAMVWLGAIQDQVRGDFAGQSDSGLTRVLSWVARNELLSQVAREQGVDVTWQDLEPARAELLKALAPLQSQFRGLAPEMRSQRVDSLLIAIGRGESVPVVPSSLAQALRRRATPAINQGPMSAVIQRLRLSRPPQPPPSTGAPFGQ